ncbi:T9SS type A sorting domain-containing protein [Kordia sp. YSTF-M3]|uniref:T9SS type A sorting domain-containing protein n=1 Tax=Kordia aestuariivivens TaxID=2759037 RepID=A0ABR7QFK6_9FLAO|nr:T9SS type A sorting domain-containing protein [Kordia aestuariivivens]MBC8757351.1 T9SS type A sorting domain-containing protein [Kordia aestuariivivens]
MKKFYIFITALITTISLFAHETTTTRLIDAYGIEYSNIQEQNDQDLKKIKASYSNGELKISSLEKTANVAIYNLLGRKVVDLKNITINGSFNRYLDLPKNNIYIVKISLPTFSKTFKIVAK